ncbi:carbohydrate ABC transporter permease [Tenggerimyces flavus]|uniref:Carbohydrate ABC transporter permease n=1 Tax=Tenggerimyces flavus TaxID=1708749 RepID=A0ABV7Y6W7_9ACTN|nr:carbohydrate ABC transporter permease [Tenggerimyces flavus]MBM7791053.1 multiple sugar transport system permease protein [Tenggerimyces flavus]
MTSTLTAPAPSRSRSAAARSRRRRPIDKGKLLAWLTIVLVGAFALLPVYWMLVTAVRPAGEVFQFPPKLLPTSVTFAHFQSFVSDPKLLGYLLNSVVVSVATAVLTLAVATYTAYSFSKFRYRGRSSLMYLVLASQMFPHALLLITLYLLFNAFGLLNSYLGLVLSFTAFTMPLCIWMLKGVFDTIPDAMIEQAKVDGAGRFTIIHRIVLPVAAPGVVAAGLFAFIRGWNDFIFALTLAGPDKQTLPPGLVNTYVGEFQTAWPALMAASLIVSVPVIVGFVSLQRYLVAGLAGGAVKG